VVLLFKITQTIARRQPNKEKKSTEMSAKCVGSTEHDIEKPKQKLTVAKKKKMITK